jgi:hypothetical protein
LLKHLLTKVADGSIVKRFDGEKFDLLAEIKEVILVAKMHDVSSHAGQGIGYSAVLAGSDCLPE